MSKVNVRPCPACGNGIQVMEGQMSECGACGEIVQPCRAPCPGVARMLLPHQMGLVTVGHSADGSARRGECPRCGRQFRHVTTVAVDASRERESMVQEFRNGARNANAFS